MANDLPEVAAATARARKMMLRANALGHHLSLGHALELVSISEGFPDWNHYSAALAKSAEASHKTHEPAVSVILMRPGDGSSVAWRMHAMCTLDRNPKKHAIVVCAYPALRSTHAWSNEAKDRTVILEVGDFERGIAWPNPRDLRGKTLLISPPEDTEIGSLNEHGGQLLGQWWGFVAEQWRQWKGRAETCLWVDVDAHRYPDAIMGPDKAFLAPALGLERHVFVQTVRDLERLDHEGLNATVFAKNLRGGDKAMFHGQWPWKGNMLVLAERQRMQTEHDFQTMRGWLNLVAWPMLPQLGRADPASPSYARCLRILAEEADAYREAYIQFSAERNRNAVKIVERLKATQPELLKQLTDSMPKTSPGAELDTDPASSR